MGEVEVLAARVREQLLECGFTVDGVMDLVGPEAYAALGRGDHLPARSSIAAQSPTTLGTLASLFTVGARNVPVEVAHRSLLADLANLGLVSIDTDGRAAAALELRPYAEPDTDWYLVSDHGPDSVGREAGEVAGDHVLGIGGASLTLAGLTPRRPVRKSLDLGTGCGIQALHLSRHSDAVCATDTNPRALRLARLSAALSGQTWDLRQGSLFDPVAGMAFDLIVSNPPFVISPTHRYIYRDAGLPADDLGRTLIESVPEHLADNGTAVVLANWLHVRGEDWRERVARWVEGTGCDAWVAQRDVQDPVEYVGLWLRDAGLASDVDLLDTYESWLRELEKLGAEGVGFGWIVLHKGGTYGEQGPRVEDVHTAPRRPRGDEVADLLECRARWATDDAVALLASRPTRAPGLQVIREDRTGEDGVLYPMPPRLRVVDGWRQAVMADSVGEHVVRACDGSATLARILDETALEFDLDADDVRAGGLALIRQVVEEGLLRL